MRFHAIGPDIQVSALDLSADIVDAEGYYTAPGAEYTVSELHIELVANGIVTMDSSVVLVLDRSFSMADVANSGFTKNELLESAVGVLHQVIQDGDEIGIARFDHEADVLLPMTPKSAGLGTVLTGGGLDPRGATSIGAGILVGHDLINGPSATKPNKAMVVLTDGNENVAPFISALSAVAQETHCTRHRCDERLLQQQSELALELGPGGSTTTTNGDMRFQLMMNQAVV